MMSKAYGPSAAPGDVLRHPLIIGLLALWAMNDHVLKAYFANVWTGKISDFAGLAVFPLMCLSAYETSCALVRREPHLRQWVLRLSLVTTGAFMVGINVSEAWATVYTQVLSIAQWPFQAVWCLLEGGSTPPLARLNVTMDPTDLWTLPALSIAWWRGKSCLADAWNKYDEATQHMHSNGPHDSATPDEINGGVEANNPHPQVRKRSGIGAL